MTPTEWGETLDLIADLWPAASKWPDKSADRCYRQLRGFNHSTVTEAVAKLRGVYPPSPASLEVKVAELAAIEARYGDGLPVLDDSHDYAKSKQRAETIRDGKDWTGWLEDVNQ